MKSLLEIEWVCFACTQMYMTIFSSFFFLRHGPLQGSTLIIAGTLFALATLADDHGLGSFCWIYGFGLGSYNYTLKAWIYEKMRAKNFSRTWSFIQSAQGLGCIFGVPATGNGHPTFLLTSQTNFRLSVVTRVKNVAIYYFTK